MVSRPKCHQCFAAFVASMGAITAGACVSWINYEEYHRENTHEGSSVEFNFEFIIFFLIAAFAAIFSYFLIRGCGPLMALKIGTMLTCIIWIIAVWLFGLYTPFHTMINLFAIMCSLSIAPTSLYVGEISQKEMRGAFASFLSLNWKIGSLIADLTFELHEAQILCLICVAICLLQFLLLFQLYEAPLFLVLTNQVERASESLIWLRGEDYDTQSELDELEKNVYLIREDRWLDMFFDCFQYRHIWSIIFGLIFFHQLTGSTLAILVSCYVIERALIDIEEYVCGLIVGSIQIFMILVSLCLVDIIGRRPLLIMSAVGVSVAAFTLGICLSIKQFGWLPFIALIGYLAMYAVGYGPILWVMVAELFPVDCKIVACPFAVALFWFFKILIDCLIQLCAYLKIIETDFEFGFLFLICAVVTLFGLIFLLYTVPETKRKTFAEIQEILK